MLALFDLLLTLLNIYTWVIIAAVVVSWLIAFRMLDTRSRPVLVIADVLERLTEPVMRPIRRVLPAMGGIDFTPLIVLLLIQFLARLIVLDIMPRFYGY